MMDRLKAKEEAAESGPVGRSISANVDLKDPASVKLAQKFGFLPADDDDDDDDDGKGEGDGEGGDPPKRRGYFDEKGNKK